MTCSSSSSSTPSTTAFSTPNTARHTLTPDTPFPPSPVPIPSQGRKPRQGTACHPSRHAQSPTDLSGEPFFVWDHLQYGERVAAIADVWTCRAAVAMRTERLLFGPMVTPLARRRPLVLARQAASLAVLSGGRFVLGVGLGDDGVGEFSAFGDEADPRVGGRMLDEGLEVLTALLTGGPVDHDGTHYAARDVRFRPAPAVPVWLAGRFGNRAPLRRAARHDGFFVIGLDGPDDLARVTAGLAEHDPAPGFEVVVDLRLEQDPPSG